MLRQRLALRSKAAFGTGAVMVEAMGLLKTTRNPMRLFFVDG
jgi:hypothetical protein